MPLERTATPDIAMPTNDPITFHEVAVIRQIIADETWLEGERRQHPVAEQDPVVIATVCEIIMRIGAQLRASLQAQQEACAQLAEQDRDDLMAA